MLRITHEAFLLIMEKLNLILFPNCEYMMVKGRYSNSWISTFGLRVFLYISG